MGFRAARLTALVTGAPFVLLAIVLVAVRFVGPVVSAALGVSNIDTRGLDEALETYTRILPAALFLMAGLVVASWPGGFHPDLWSLIAIFLTAFVALQWAGVLDPSLRIFTGGLVDTILDGSVAAAIAAYLIMLDRRVRRADPTPLARDGLRALGGGFALAYVLAALQLVDYREAFGGPAPSGLLWILAYGPTLTLSFLSVYLWLEVVVVRARGPRAGLRAFGLPALVTALGVAASTGMGGFILSHTSAWGGGYLVFPPTDLSLAIVGFALGAFLSIAWALRGQMPRASWWPIVGGIAVAVLAGVRSFGGTLASLAGIVLGLALAARGLVEAAPSAPTTVEPEIMRE